MKMTMKVATENTSLLQLLQNNNTELTEPSPDSNPDGVGNASYQDTIINLMKICMGTGTLALPFSAQKGGIILNIFGLLGIASWNKFCVDRLCKSLALYQKYSPSLMQKEEFITDNVKNISTFSKIAWLSFGVNGIHGLDALLIILFLGIIVAYEDAVLGFLADTPFSVGIRVDAFFVSTLIGILSLASDLGRLAKASAFGLSTLLIAFIITVIFGTTSSNKITSTTTINGLWPQDGLTGACHWFGCVVFGFGVVPVTYNCYDSMREPHRLVQATSVALYGVAVLYILIGYCFLLLYPGVIMEGDILEELLPKVGIIPAFVRLSMIVMIVLTSPLLVIPCSLIVEGKMKDMVPSEEDSLEHDSNYYSSHNIRRIMIRMSICMFGAFVGVSIPGFVYILSFVGCFAVALVGFILPPLLHMTLVLKYEERTRVIFDIIMIIFGLSATIVSSIITFQKLK